MNKKTVELGDLAKDIITGFTGVVVAETRWLFNCRRVTLQPTELTDKGGVPITEVFDDSQLVVVRKGAVGVTKPVETGGMDIPRTGERR